MIHNHVSPRARKRAAKWRLAQLIKLNSGCVDCGYKEHAVALQFDHIDDNKHMNVSDMIRSDYSWITIKLEIDKCEVVCANCHAIRTASRKLVPMTANLAVAEMPTLVDSEDTYPYPYYDEEYPQGDVGYWIGFTEPIFRNN